MSATRVAGTRNAALSATENANAVRTKGQALRSISFPNSFLYIKSKFCQKYIPSSSWSSFVAIPEEKHDRTTKEMKYKTRKNEVAVYANHQSQIQLSDLTTISRIVKSKLSTVALNAATVDSFRVTTSSITLLCVGLRHR